LVKIFLKKHPAPETPGAPVKHVAWDCGHVQEGQFFSDRSTEEKPAEKVVERAMPLLLIHAMRKRKRVRE
jgi:hypothetical protein